MTETPTLPGPPAKRADELQAGDWTAAGQYADRIDGTDDAEVLFVYRFAAGGGDRLSVLIQELAIAEPISIYLDAADQIPLLTADEIATMKDDRLRHQLAAELRELADLIVDRKLPVPEHALQIMGYPKTEAEVREAAEKLGVPLKEDGKRLDLNWPKGRMAYERGHVYFHFWAAKDQPAVEPKPDPNSACAEHDDAHLGSSCPDATIDELGLTYSREDDDPQVIRPMSPRVPMHTGAVVDGGELVDETPAEPNAITVYFSFGHGHTDPGTGKDLVDHYVTIVGPSHAACREAMFASKYGRAWGFDYIAGEPQAEEWIPQWTEHDRIVLPVEPVSETA